MKVFDLRCTQDHVFEGWFGSEDDFRSQLDRGLLECPMCGSQEITKGLSAPRLNLGAQPPAAAMPAPRDAAAPVQEHQRKLHALQAAWLEASRKIVEKTEDVVIASPMKPCACTRAKSPATQSVARPRPSRPWSCWKKGVPVLPLALPKGSKQTLQ